MAKEKETKERLTVTVDPRVLEVFTEKANKASSSVSAMVNALMAFATSTDTSSYSESPIARELQRGYRDFETKKFRKAIEGLILPLGFQAVSPSPQSKVDEFKSALGAGPDVTDFKEWGLISEWVGTVNNQKIGVLEAMNLNQSSSSYLGDGLHLKSREGCDTVYLLAPYISYIGDEVLKTAEGANLKIVGIDRFIEELNA